MKDSTPRLKQITLLREKVKNWEEYPFNIPVIKNFDSIQILSKVCFLIGENGSGKSTLLEAIAGNYGFGKEGGSKHIAFSTAKNDSNKLSDYLRLSWSYKTLGGYFFRAESFFNLATYIDDVEAEDSYGGKSLHQQSHGQAFLALFNNRLSAGGFYLLDEPEAALSPKRQLSLLVVIHQIIKENPGSQFIIATHSPILLSYPNAQIFSFNEEQLTETTYEETEAYQITKDFLNTPSGFLKRLFDE